MTTAPGHARPRIVLGNWKQHLVREAARDLAASVAEGVSALDETQLEGLQVGIAPTLVCLETVRATLGGAAHIALVAQDCAGQDEGAHTGEVGPAMLIDVGVDAAIIGHSERRMHYGDGEALVAAKLSAALGGGLQAILCVGESLEIRDRGEHESHVISQLSSALSNVSPEAASRLVVAYEPVWAIGTGRSAAPEQAAAMHRTIRTWLDGHYPGGLGAGRSVLYGGSVKPNNAADLIAAGDVDGFLVGGASLDPAAFLDIVLAATAQSSAR